MTKRTGPAPLPTAVRKLRGTDYEKPKFDEPEPEIILWADPPEHFNDPDHFPEPVRDHALEQWNRLVPLFGKIGTFTQSDYNALARYCELSAIYEKARSEVFEFTRLTTTNAAGTTIPLPSLKILLDLDTKLLKLEQEFGMTPSSRTRIQALPLKGGKGKGKKKDPFAPK